MSCYTSVFLRKRNEFIELSCTSRNSEISQAFENISVPFERIRAISKEEINDLIDKTYKEVKSYEEMIAAARNKIEMIKNFNNSAEEKITAINDELDYISELEEELGWKRHAHSFMCILNNTYETAQYTSDDYETSGVDVHNFIYVGMEISNPTIEDIK